MTDYEKQQLFYQQFNTVVHNHQEWLNTPQGTLEVLRDPWKAQPPTVQVSPSGSANPKDILNMLRQRKAQQMATNPDYGNVI
jgi:hypothetical protein